MNKHQVSSIKNKVFKNSLVNWVTCLAGRRVGLLGYSRLRAGFTLIELLISIAIMAILVTVLFPNFIGARQRARDYRRKNDLSQMQKALELYKLDQNPPVYPTTGAFQDSDCDQCFSQQQAECAGNIYMRKIPCDPSGGTARSYFYIQDPSDDLRYTLSACLENPSDPDRDVTTVPACGEGGTSYTINEP